MKRSQPIKWNNHSHHLCNLQIKKLADLIKDTFPREAGLGWDIQKMHEMMAVANDFNNFGCTSNFDASAREMLLQTFVKVPGCAARHTTNQEFMESLAVREHKRNALQHAIQFLELKRIFVPKCGREQNELDESFSAKPPHADDASEEQPANLNDNKSVTTDLLDHDNEESSVSSDQDVEQDMSNCAEGMHANFGKCNAHWDWELLFSGNEGRHETI